MAMVDTVTMDMVDMVDIVIMAMAREKLNQLLSLSQDIFIMATPTDMVMDMVDTVIMATMEREKLKLPLDIIMVTMDMEDTDTHMVTMAMDTMVKQQLFIFLTVSNIDWNLSESSQQKHTPLF